MDSSKYEPPDDGYGETFLTTLHPTTTLHLTIFSLYPHKKYEFPKSVKNPHNKGNSEDYS
jgi:hypothetical protein